MKNLVTLLQEGVNTVKVRFSKDDSKLYTYKTNLNLAVNDLCIVKVATTGAMKVVQVVVVDDHIDVSRFDEIQLQWIIQRVDMTMYDQLVERDSAMEQLITDLEVERKRKELVESMKENLGTKGMKLLDKINKKITPNDTKRLPG